jgi:uncharacterized lipoprotein YddW (UPF0748 family)
MNNQGPILIAAVIAILLISCLYFFPNPITGNLPFQPEPFTDPNPDRIKMATMWLDSTHDNEIRSMIREMNQAGANTIAIHVHEQGLMFFNDRATGLPTQNIMPVIIDEARRNNLKVFAWTDTLNFPELIETHPEWEFVTCYRHGEYHYPSPCGWHSRLSPFSPGIDSFIEEYYRGLASLDIDGIQFQDDLFLAEGEDISDAAQEAYLDHYGTWFNPANPGDWEKMNDLKTRRLVEIVRIAIQSAREVNPDILFVFDILPEPSTTRMKQWWGIDIDSLKDAGVDYFGIMSYHRQVMKEQDLSLGESMDYLNRAFDSISSQVGRERTIYRIWTTTFDQSHVPLPEQEIDYVLERMFSHNAYHVGYFPHHPRLAREGIFRGLDQGESP